MPTNNSINLIKPIPRWFIYLANTQANVLGGAVTYNYPFDTVLYAEGGVTYLSPSITIPTSGYYLINAGFKMSGLDATNTSVTMSFFIPTQTIHMDDSGAVIRDAANSTSYSSSEITYLNAAETCHISSNVNGNVGVSLVGGAAPDYVTWFSGTFLYT